METEISISFCLLIVLYETPPAAAQTIQTLLATSNLSMVEKVVILDHSAREQRGECLSLCAPLGGRLVYEHDPGNPPLGIAYNRAIRRHLGDATYVVVLDQDTELPGNFLACAAAAAEERGQPSSMAANIVSSGRIASPCWSLFGWGRSWKSEHRGWHSWKFCSAITSASCIHRRVFVDFGLYYSEKLVLYGIDTDFFRRLAHADPRFFVLPISIQHSLSFDEASAEQKIGKLDQIFSANRQIYSDAAWPSRLVVHLLEMLLRVKYSIKYRNLLFLSDQSRQRHD